MARSEKRGSEARLEKRVFQGLKKEVRLKKRDARLKKRGALCKFTACVCVYVYTYTSIYIYTYY